MRGEDSIKIENLFKFYDYVAYAALKYSLTIPAVIAGNMLDLLTLGIPKRLIDVSPLMTSIPFFKEATRDKEQAYAGSSLLNKGFAGVLRGGVSIFAEIPVTVAAKVIACIVTALHVLIANTVGVPLMSIAAFVAENMCGSCKPS